ncbi:HAMP domain-containing histidine kinase [Hymenobacter sp. J193]|uniref:sensor histidine kinase n=1 Tax=Hymenobacter sp. J193 TaxID=2898429 RepID=UPI00215100BE|nr:HAMP domain-containing sensor histidine kinase [Hymenobacter sp. J193]MCR5889716.1 HAMP domain-containing histidine kinase [Hymenobacter sp. J193]
MSAPSDEPERPAGLDLRLTQESAEDLYEQAPCGYCSCLPDGTLVKLNQTLLAWLGYAREEVVAQRTLQHLLTIGGALHFEMHGMPLLLLQGHVRELSYQLRRKDGTSLPVLLNADLVRDWDGSPLVMRIMLVDITDRRQYELELLRTKNLAEQQREQLAQANAALQTSNEQLRRANVDLDSFIYSASHDLRLPITNIEGLVQLLREQLAEEQGPTGELQPVLAMMQESVERFKRTIEHLSDVTKLQKEHAPPTTDVPLWPVVEDVCQDLKPLIVATGATLEVDVAACPTVPFSTKYLRSVVYNLLSNALKFRHPDRVPQVQIRCRSEAAYVVLEVQDNGLGIEQAYHAELFIMFRRLHNHVEGSGIGLFMVKRSVENQGGKVEVRSTPGVGSTFTVYFRR